MKFNIFSIITVCYLFLSSNMVFGQFTKTDVEQIINSYNIKDYKFLKITISSTEKYLGEMQYFNNISCKTINIEFEENYIIIEDQPERKFHIPYNRIKVISSFPEEQNGKYKHITVFLDD